MGYVRTLTFDSVGLETNQYAELQRDGGLSIVQYVGSPPEQGYGLATVHFGPEAALRLLDLLTKYEMWLRDSNRVAPEQPKE